MQREKISRLTDRIEQRFGGRPRSFRAGRYGISSVGARILEELGYQVDSSVIPFSDFSSQRGPDFRRAPWTPYWTGGDDICVPQESGSLLEVPVSIGFNRPDFERAQRILDRVSRPVLRSLHTEGILDRLGIVQRIKFSPEQSNSHRMNKLVKTYLGLRAPCAVMMLHSSSLVPGYSPYVPTATRLEEFYRDLKNTFRCALDHGMVSQTLGSLAGPRRPSNSMTHAGGTRAETCSHLNR